MTEKLVRFIHESHVKPKTFISASAVGYYGISGDLIFTEDTETPGNDFLATVAKKWETAARKAEGDGVRTVLSRFGVILGKQGALPMMALPFRLFCGGTIGNGEQWMSWVHIDDVVEMIMYCLHHPSIQGPVNLTAPTPLQHKDFMNVLANVLHRPYWTKIPAPLFRLGAGEMAQLVADGQFVLPKKLTDHGYQFQHWELRDALKQIYRTK
ncbi:TIGR01777 family oxidoreductase [Virgibacillus sp. 179-BFC.A HS]|uniref:TIGR01777 family oxidoreductase n=1 Tax=Tigheibacillus jepli TaxID=3035914 RepID=A0ABU5CM53_9BACI|nr:TIGR01777 family oxidoreductase [Virgibacillus sp. 179-BFC.A HS]MDY0406874.1 TIGR01777 family oxidoreductase [Virgibacillus sp. 179-BFC.A HS]